MFLYRKKLRSLLDFQRNFYKTSRQIQIDLKNFLQKLLEKKIQLNYIISKLIETFSWKKTIVDERKDSRILKFINKFNSPLRISFVRFVVSRWSFQKTLFSGEKFIQKKKIFRQEFRK